jgi:hypothetical protein
MYSCEDAIKNELESYEIKKALREEYYHDDVDSEGDSMVEYCFEEAIKRYPYVKDEDEIDDE